MNLPDSTTSTIPLKYFAAREGYFYRDEDADPPSAPDFWPNPELDNSEFSYSWQGITDEYDVLLTVNQGQLIGLITGNTKRWSIESAGSGSDDYTLIDVRSAGFPPSDVALETLANYSIEVAPNDFDVPDDEVYISHYKKIDAKQNQTFNRLQNPTVLDILIVWTEDARIGAGGSPIDPNDTLGIDTLITAAIDHNNLALDNSLTNTRVSRFHTAKLSGFIIASGFAGAVSARNRLINFTSVNNLRDSVGADLVVAVVKDNFSLCGITFVQTKPGCDSTLQGSCGIGSAFNNYSYAIVNQLCAIADDTFTHEVGHMMGANHVATEVPAPGGQLPGGWVADVSGNGYPEAFATLIPSTFASIMSIDANTPRRLYFSNPNIIVNGVATGDPNTRYNAKIIDDLSPTMSVFRDRPDLIFMGDFE